MIEANNPVVIGEKEISKWKKGIETLLTRYSYRNTPCSLPNLMMEVDPKEEFILTPIEADTYMAVRDGMQVFRTLYDMLSEKTGMQTKIAYAKDQDADPEVAKLRDFNNSYAMYAASLYISKRAGDVLRKHGLEGVKETRDMSFARLSTNKKVEPFIMDSLAPIYAAIFKHKETAPVRSETIDVVPKLDNILGIKKPLDAQSGMGATEKKGEPFFANSADFLIYVQGLFQKYAEIAKTVKGKYSELDTEVEKYQFKIMDDAVVLFGYDDKSLSKVGVKTDKKSFQPMRPDELVGNKNAKRKIVRIAERLALYDPVQQMNPMLELGGLPWTVLSDGIPGTGKSSLYRVLMTLVDELSQKVGIPYQIITVDQSIKDEFYGKTAKILNERLAVANDPSLIAIGIFDDLDLLVSNRDSAQGADNDITNILMQYLDGVFTVRRGNIVNFAASNKPTGLDDALRNRMNERLLIDGPVSAEDFADMLHLKLGKMMKLGLLKMENGGGYTPFATQDVKKEDGSWTAENVASYVTDKFSSAKYKNVSVLEFGKFMEELKKQNPKISGRSGTAIFEAIKQRAADFDIPKIWFDDRKVYFEKPYLEKVKLVQSLYKPIDRQVLIEEAQRYADSEARYTNNDKEKAIQDMIENHDRATEAKTRLEQREGSGKKD